jgi:hypothetical protein
MIQLTYQPALDPFHSVFRLLRLLPYVASVGALHRDHVRILDFYILFPFRISAARLMPHHRRFRKFETSYENRKPYGEQPDDVVMFSRMHPIQLTAMETLADKLVIDPMEWRSDRVKRTDVELPHELAERVVTANAEEPEIADLMTALSKEYSLSGQNGLKNRTGLLEYRYDAV